MTKRSPMIRRRRLWIDGPAYEHFQAAVSARIDRLIDERHRQAGAG